MRNTHEDFLKKFHGRYDATEYTVLSVYSKNDEKIDIRHNVCGSIKSVMPKSAMDSKKHGATCLICSPVKKTGIKYGDMTETDFNNHVSSNYPDYKFKLLVPYSHKQNDSIEVEHNCGHIFLSRPEYWLRNEGKCNVCANKVRKEHIQKMQMKDNYLENLTKDTDYIFVEEYKKDNKLKHTLLHKACNRTYDVRPNDFQQGYRCPHCSQEKTESYASADITNFLIERNIPFEKEKKLDGCVFKNDLRFDFAIKHPFLDKLLLVEYDGEQHFKSSGMFNEEKVKLTQERDVVKNKFCEDNKEKFVLKRIRYDENHMERIQIILIDFLFDIQK